MVMSGLLVEFLGTFARALVVFFAGTMVSHGIWNEDQASRFTPYMVQIITGAAVAVALALYQRYRARVAVQTALDMPRGTSPAELKEELKSGRASSIFKSPLLVLAMLTLASPIGCALSSKGKVVTLYESTQTALEALQDAETEAYDSKLVSGLTPAVHAKVQRTFAAAFDAQEKLAGPLKLWKAGQPLPQDYVTWLASVNDVVAVVEDLVLPKAGSLAARSVAWAKTAVAVMTQLQQAVPPRLSALAGS